MANTIIYFTHYLKGRHMEPRKLVLRHSVPFKIFTFPTFCRLPVALGEETQPGAFPLYQGEENENIKHFVVLHLITFTGVLVPSHDIKILKNIPKVYLPN